MSQPATPTKRVLTEEAHNAKSATRIPYGNLCVSASISSFLTLTSRVCSSACQTTSQRVCRISDRASGKVNIRSLGTFIHLTRYLRGLRCQRGLHDAEIWRHPFRYSDAFLITDEAHRFNNFTPAPTNISIGE